LSFEFDDQEVITNIYNCVKRYGQSNGLDSFSLVPMTEFMKPSSLQIANEMINTDIHLNGAKNQDYYKTEKFFFDYSCAYDFDNKGML
jgi:hypothetical protein